MIGLAYIVLGIAPSLIWLSYYLRKDVHPEPKKEILESFARGALAALLAALIETFIIKKFFPAGSLTTPVIVLFFFMLMALTEETLKYFVIRATLLSDPDFDEPVDVIIHLIIVALGFAALENVALFFFNQLAIGETIIVSTLRFIGATFLHTLCSGLLGFFIALSFFRSRKRNLFFFVGLSLATLLHGLYNFSIIQLGGYLKALIPFSVLLLLSVVLLLGFRKVKTLKSICDIKR